MDIIEAKTFTPIYDEVEDRIRLIINIDKKNRVDLMITRAFIIKLLPLFEEFYEKHYNEFRLDSITIDSRNDNEENSNSIIVKIDYELLMSVNLSFNKDNKQTILELITKNKKIVGIFNEELFNSFIKLLKGAIPKFSWGLGFNF